MAAIEELKAATPERTYRRWQARARAGQSRKCPWPTPAQARIEVAAVATATDWPAWRHRKVTALLHADGIPAAESTVKRVLGRNDLLLPVNHTAVLRELAAARRAAFVIPPWRRNQVWQLDFSEYETLAESTWRIAGCADYWANYEFGFHVATTGNHRDAIARSRSPSARPNASWVASLWKTCRSTPTPANW